MAALLGRARRPPAGLACPAYAGSRPDFDMVRQRKNPFSYRLRLVTHARQHGLQAAARAFPTTRPPVRKGCGAFRPRV